MYIKVKNFVFRIVYLLILLYLIIFIPKFWGYSPLVVISNSMSPTLKVGGILYYSEEMIENYDRGDILVYEVPEHIISHRIVDQTNKGYVTKGDSNNTIDSKVVEYNQVLGKGTNWSIPYIGYYADFVYNHKYLLFISVAMILLDLFNDYYKNHKKKVVIRNEKSN